MSHNSKADLKRVIIDKVSAQSIAEYLVAHPDKVIYQQQDYWGSLRKQWSFVKMLTQQSTQLLNQLESLVYSANPEILKCCQEETPGWVLELLKQYPTAVKCQKQRHQHNSVTDTIRIRGTSKRVKNGCKNKRCICYRLNYRTTDQCHCHPDFTTEKNH